MKGVIIMDANDNYGLLLPIEHLEELMKKQEMGIEVALSDLEKLEINKYMKIMSSQLFDDDEDGDDTLLSPEEEARRAEIMKQHIEEAKRKARTKDVAIIKLTEEQKQQLREDMSSAYVRPDPSSFYNKTDDQLYKSAEEKVLSDKLNRIRNCYYDAEEWRTVVNLILTGIEFELKSDKFSYLGSYENRLKAFKEGKIKMQVKMPKLYLNRISPETNPEVLKGIYDGDITVVDKNTKSVRHKSYKNSELIHLDISSISPNEHQYYLNMHRRGYFTPISGAIKAKSTIYNRYIDTKNNSISKPLGIVDKDGIPIQYDWLKFGPQEYFRMLHKIKPKMDDIVYNVQKSNGNKLSKVLLERMNEVVKVDKDGYYVEQCEPNWISSSVQVKPEVVKLEQELLNSIQVTNP